MGAAGCGKPPLLWFHGWHDKSVGFELCPVRSHVPSAQPGGHGPPRVGEPPPELLFGRNNQSVDLERSKPGSDLHAPSRSERGYSGDVWIPQRKAAASLSVRLQRQRHQVLRAPELQQHWCAEAEEGRSVRGLGAWHVLRWAQ